MRAIAHFLVAASFLLFDNSAAEPFHLKAPVRLSEAFYVPINELSPGQLRYSSRNVQDKIDKKIAKGAARWNEEKGHWQPLYHQGTSIFSIKEAIPVVQAPFGYVPTDGHHSILTSFALEGISIPVRVIADLSALSESEFWEEAERQGFAYLYNTHGERCIPPRDFSLLEDDPNRYFAAITARKYFANGDINDSQGSKDSLWIKIGKDIPFIEFKIADILWQHQLVYSYDMGLNPPKSFLEEAYQALIAAQLPGLRLIPERTFHVEL